MYMDRVHFEGVVEKRNEPCQVWKNDKGTPADLSAYLQRLLDKAQCKPAKIMQVISAVGTLKL